MASVVLSRRHIIHRSFTRTFKNRTVGLLYRKFQACFDLQFIRYLTSRRMSSPAIHLYHWYPSFYSQKVRMALEERQVSYTSTIICLLHNEQNQAWYMRLNPAGQVPMLKIGDKYITGSEEIADAINVLDATGPKLQADVNTTEGKLVSVWRERLFAVNVEPLTFGTMLNPEIAKGKLSVYPLFNITKAEFNERLMRVGKNLEAMKEKYPDLTDALDQKIALNEKRMTVMYEKSAAEAVLDNLETLFDDVEVQLRTSRTENILEHWLCAASFSLADISLCVLLGRLLLLGHLERFLVPETRPALVEYWRNAQTRPSIKKVVFTYRRDAILYVARHKLRKVALGTLGLAGVVALGAWIAHKYKS